jgi:hypothetical protein
MVHNCSLNTKSSNCILKIPSLPNNIPIRINKSREGNPIFADILLETIQIIVIIATINKY